MASLISSPAYIVQSSTSSANTVTCPEDAADLCTSATPMHSTYKLLVHVSRTKAHGMCNQMIVLQQCEFEKVRKRLIKVMMLYVVASWTDLVP